MKKLLSLIATAVLFAVGLSAQPTVVTVGDETSTDEDFGPIKSYDRNSFSEVVYLSSELQPGIITSISYHYVAGDPLLDPAPTIYLYGRGFANFICKLVRLGNCNHDAGLCRRKRNLQFGLGNNQPYHTFCVQRHGKPCCCLQFSKT